MVTYEVEVEEADFLADLDDRTLVAPGPPEPDAEPGPSGPPAAAAPLAIPPPPGQPAPAQVKHKLMKVWGHASAVSPGMPRRSHLGAFFKHFMCDILHVFSRHSLGL